MNKILNSKCYCNEGLSWIKSSVIMFLPCEHMIHKHCDKIKYFVNNCPLCDKEISKRISLRDFKNIFDTEKNYDNYQRFVDILSVTNFDSDTKINYNGVTDNIVKLMSTLIRVPKYRGVNDGVRLCEEILSLNHTKINIHGEEKLKLVDKKIFISNHTSHLDFLVLFYILKSGFLASSILHDTIVGRMLSKIVKCLIIERGKKCNTVEKMRDYVEENGSICLFPEGLISHPSTLTHFRTGAFNIGFPVIPIVLKYSRPIYDNSIKNFILKIASKDTLEIDMYILDPEFPPFTDTDINNIRLKMAAAGDLMLSRVSNRDIKD